MGPRVGGQRGKTSVGKTGSVKKFRSRDAESLGRYNEKIAKRRARKLKKKNRKKGG